jgi:type IV pilus assembly protein PilX
VIVMLSTGQLCKGRRRDRGAALIVALILLLVMTLLGVTALNSSTMQGLMSASFQQQTSTLAGVENVLLAAERDVEDIVANGLGERTHFFDLLSDPPPGQFPAGDSGANWAVAAVLSEQVGALDIFGQFVIEYMGDFEVPGESIAEGGSFQDSRIHIFRVSARGTEQQRQGLRIVQTLYVTLRGPTD